jgi:ribosomal protein L23
LRETQRLKNGKKLEKKSCMANKEIKIMSVLRLKPIIKKALQQLFQVNILSIRTSMQPVKKRRVGTKSGARRTYKKAFIKLIDGESINLFPES